MRAVSDVLLHIHAVCNAVLRVLVTYLGMFCSYIPVICLGVVGTYVLFVT